MRTLLLALPLAALLVAVGSTLGLTAQESRIDLAKATIAPAAAKPGDVVTIQVDVTPREGWHVYGKLEIDAEPPSIVPGVDWLKPKGISDLPDGEEHETFGVKSYWVDHAFTLKQQFTVAANAPAGAHLLNAAVRHVACTEQFCDPVADEPFEVKIVIAAAAEAEPGPWIDVAHQGRATMKIRVSPARARAGETVTIESKFEIEPGWHVYGKLDPTDEYPKILPGDGAPTWLVPAGPTDIADGEEHDVFGVKSYWLEFEAEPSRKFRVGDGAPVGSAKIPISITYMACNDEICEPKVIVPAAVTLEILEGKAAVEPEPEPASGTAETKKGTDSAAVASSDDATKMNLFALILASIGAGLFALAMPCTYPMIPITISFFTKQADQRDGNVLPLSLTYGAGIVVIFMIIGAVATPFIVPFAAHPITNLVIGVAFLVFGLSLFGIINLQPPQFLMQSAAKASGRGGLFGVFLMGATLVVTSFTCTAPFIGLLLGAAAKVGGLTTVVIGMGVFGLTMAIPFVFLSLVPGKLKSMPKSGGWMNTLKVCFGFVEIAAALKFLSNADLVWNAKAPWLTRELFLVLWAGLFFCCSLFLFGFVKLKGETGEIGPGRLLTAVCTFCLAAYFTHGATGYRLDNFVMQALEPPPLSQRVDGGSTGTAAKADKPVIIKDDYDAALATAKKQGKKLLVNFTGHT